MLGEEIRVVSQLPVQHVLVHDATEAHVGGLDVLGAAQVRGALHELVPHAQRVDTLLDRLGHAIHLDVDQVVSEETCQVQIVQLLNPKLRRQLACAQVYRQHQRSRP